MTENQIRVVAETTADAEAALDSVDPRLTAQIRRDQEDIAEKRRIAQSNDEILKLYVRGVGRALGYES